MSSKNFFHDRLVLLLLSINAFLAVLSAAAVLFRLTGVRNQSYIVEYRSNLGLSGFTNGNKSAFVSFILFVLLVTVFHTVLSRRVYHLRRHFSITILGLGTVLIVLAAIVSNALLAIG